MTYPVSISFTFTGTASDLRAQIINPSSGATIGGEILAAAFLSTGSNGYILNFTADSASGDTQAVKIYTSGNAAAPLFPAFTFSTPVSGGSSLSGPSAVTLTFEDEGGAPVPLVDFSIAGQGIGRSDGEGVATFGLADGDYTVVARATSGVLFANTSLTVDGATALMITGSSIPVTPADDPDRTTGYLTTYDETGAIDVGVPITLQLIQTADHAPALSHSIKIRTESSDANGLVQFSGLLRKAIYRGRRGEDGPAVDFTTDDAPTTPLPEILGQE